MIGVGQQVLKALGRSRPLAAGSSADSWVSPALCSPVGAMPTADYDPCIGKWRAARGFSLGMQRRKAGSADSPAASTSMSSSSPHFTFRYLPPTPSTATSLPMWYQRRPSGSRSVDLSRSCREPPLQTPPRERRAPVASSSYQDSDMEGRIYRVLSRSRRARASSSSQEDAEPEGPSRRRGEASPFPAPKPRSLAHHPDVQYSSEPSNSHNLYPRLPTTSNSSQRPRLATATKPLPRPRPSLPSSSPPQIDSASSIQTRKIPTRAAAAPHVSKRHLGSRDPPSTFRLDQPQAHPAPSMSVRDISAVDFDHILSGQIPGGWSAGPEVASSSGRQQHEDSDPDPDPEEWARQRRTSSLLSGIGVVFGSISLAPVTLAEEKEPDSESDEDHSLRPAARSFSPDRRESCEPESPSGGSGSECFESAEEGEEGTSSPSGRRISGSRRRRSSQLAGEPFGSADLPTIIDNSPVLDSSSTFCRSLLSPSPTPTSRAAVSIAFGYAYDGPVLNQPTIDFIVEDTDATPNSVKQLVRESWRFSQPLSGELTPDEEKRIWTRATERLAIDDEGLSLQITDMVGSKLASRSSYTPSSRPLVSPPSRPPFTRSDSVASSRASTRAPQLIPTTPHPFPTVAPGSAPIDYFDAPRVARKRDPSASSATRPRPASMILDADLRRRTSSASLASSSSPRPLASPALSTSSTFSSSTGSLPRPQTSRPLSRRLSVDLLRPRPASAVPESPALTTSKSARRLSMLFNMVPTRSPSMTKDDISSFEPPRSPRPARREPSPARRPYLDPAKRPARPTSVISSPISTPVFSSSSTFSTPTSTSTSTFRQSSQSSSPPSPLMGSSPFTNRTWRSTISTGEYDLLLKQYGRLEMRRQEVIWEMCETERSFVTGLRGVTRVFTLPLRTPEGTWIKGIPIPVSRLLDWLDDILAVHARISDALQLAVDTRRLAKNPVVVHIADVFLPYISQLEVHQPYLVRFEAVTQAIDSMTADSASDFGEFVRMQSSLPECGALSLSSFLLKPVQRLMKYPLFFKQLAELTPPTHPDRGATLSLLRSIDSIIRVMQEVKTREDEYEEAKVLQSRIRGLPEGFKLARRDRRLVAHGLLRRVHISDRDRTVLDMDVMIRTSSAKPRATNVLRLAPDAGALAPAVTARRHSTISDSGSSARSVGSLTYSDTSGASRASPATPATSSFETLLHPESLSFSNFAMTKTEAPKRIPMPVPRIIKTKAKESLVYVFVFSDLIVLATKSTDPVRFIRTPKTSNRRLEQGPTYKALETIGLSRVLGVSDLSGKTEHDHLLEVDLLPLPSGDEATPFNTAAHATSIYFTVPNRPPSTTRSGGNDSPVQERTRWMQAFERSYLCALRSLSFPSHLNAHTAPITLSERLSCTSFLDAGVIPKSPSEQQVDRIDDSSNVTSAKPGGAQAEREERAYWAVRLKKVRRELEGTLDGKMSGHAPIGGVGAAPWSPHAKSVKQERRSSIRM